VIRGRRIGVIVPAFNEERLIGKTLGGMPPGVDRVVVVDDGSADGTATIIASIADARVAVVTHPRNLGLGQALATGYRRALDEPSIDIWVVMAGDNQMDPDDLPALVEPIIEGRAMYVKGNRLFYPSVWRVMPRHRFVGNAALTLFTKFATGYFHLLDPQCGYTAIHRDAIRFLDLERPHRGYGYNAALLMQLNIYNVAVVDVPVRPVYGDAVSKIRLRSYIPRVGWLLFRSFVHRIAVKYVVRDFHPVGLAYLMLAGLVPVALWSGGVLTYHRLRHLTSAVSLDMLPTLMLFVLTALASLMVFLFAVWMDIEYTRSGNRMIQVPPDRR
jgi:glycosyltransferase involved in cell wall biosynthesis